MGGFTSLKFENLLDSVWIESTQCFHGPPTLLLVPAPCRQRIFMIPGENSFKLNDVPLRVEVAVLGGNTVPLLNVAAGEWRRPET